MAALGNRAGHYIIALWFLLLLSFVHSAYTVTRVEELKSVHECNLFVLSAEHMQKI